MMQPITLRRLKRTDCFKSGFCATWEIEGLTALVDDRIVGFAGVQRFGRHYWTFCDLFESGVVPPAMLHRLVKNVLAGYARLGIGPIYSIAYNTRWHEVLGFRPVTDAERDDEIRFGEATAGKEAWVIWHRSQR